MSAGIKKWLLLLAWAAIFVTSIVLGVLTQILLVPPKLTRAAENALHRFLTRIDARTK
jgi:hypothetical protein